MGMRRGQLLRISPRDFIGCHSSPGQTRPERDDSTSHRGHLGWSQSQSRAGFWPCLTRRPWRWLRFCLPPSCRASGLLGLWGWSPHASRPSLSKARGRARMLGRASKSWEEPQMARSAGGWPWHVSVLSSSGVCGLIQLIHSVATR